ncbi:hypothetical protein CPC08DRAFT_818541 [Agrocybe pediades]|nr:hypothetical protein CPC08DRAFT_818541 [Agrocybe pediades]
MPPTPPDIPPVPPPEPRPPRPPNSWILFRAYMMKQIRDAEDPKATRLTQTQISIIIANMWKTADDATRAEFERRAEEAKAAHRLKHPNYRYRPRKKEDKERERQANQLKRELKRLEKSARGRQEPIVPPLNAIPFGIPAGAPYYIPSHLHYPTSAPALHPCGPAGPSPPLSLASTPSASPAVSPSALPPQNPLPTLTVPVTSVPEPVFAPASTPDDFLASLEAQSHAPAEVPVDFSSFLNIFQDVPTSQEPLTSVGVPSTATDSLNFNVAVDPEYQRDMQTLVHYDADLLASYNDLFILSNIGEFNPEALIEVHMAVGGYQEHESAANFMSTSQVPFSPFHSEAGSLPHMEAPGPDFYRQFDPVLNISAPSEQAAYGMHQEDAFQANYQYPFASEEDSLSTLLPHAEVSQSRYTPIAEHLVDFDLPNQSTAYNPPAGASHSSNRRVAGDWTTHFLKTTASPRISS